MENAGVQLPANSGGPEKRANVGPPRWFLPLVVGVLTFAFVWSGQSPPGVSSDFDYLWAGGVAVWQGENPYTFVGDLARETASIAPDTPRLRNPYYCPATAAVLMAPFGALPRQLAVSLFTALGMALLALSAQGWRQLTVVSAPAFQCVIYGPWTPWLVAAIGLPWLGFVWAAKPSIGAALFTGWPSRWALWGGLALVALSFLLLPHWPTDWLETLQGTSHYRAPVQRFGGPLLLLASLRWRRPEARLLGLMALIPHTTGIYEQLPLLLIPQTKRSFAVMMGFSFLAAVLVYTVVSYDASPTVLLRVQRGLTRQWPYFLVLVWLPALYMVLRPSVLTTPAPSADRQTVSVP